MASPDPFTTSAPLGDGWTPAGAQLVTYRTGVGLGVSYAHVFARSQERLWLVVPADGVLGSAQETFVAHLAEQVRQAGPNAVALLTHWPREYDHRAWLCRVTFDSADGREQATSRTVVIDEGTGHAMAHNVRSAPVRFTLPHWKAVGIDALESETGLVLPLLRMSQAEITEEVARRDDWEEIRDRCVASQEDGVAALEATQAEWHA